MREVVVATLASLDGVQADPMAWIGDMFDDAAAAAALDALERADAMLMGRTTYEYFAPLWPHIPGPHADRVNAIKKYVFSSSLSAVEWSNAELVRTSAQDAVRELKEQGDGDLVVYGYGRFAQGLIDAGVVDRAEFSVFPVLLGEGTPMLGAVRRTRLRFKSADARPAGVIQLSYTVQDGGVQEN